MTDLKSIDFHLLACFDHLIDQGSVTQAAARMGLSQPAMSNALARLRELFNDQLLVRTSRGMVPTPRALELHRLVRDTLQAFADQMSEGHAFDPATSEARFRIAITDYTSSLLVPDLLPLIRREAPGIELSFATPDQSRAREWLEHGEMDLTIGYFVDLSDGLRAVELVSDDVCCLVARDHPTIQGAIDLAQYVAASHIRRGHVAANQFTLEATVDRALEQLGLRRRVALRTQSAFGMAQAVAFSDLVGTIGRSGADAYRKMLGVQVLPLPFDAGPAIVSMVWHERTHRHPAARWLRDAVRRCGAWEKDNAHARAAYASAR